MPLSASGAVEGWRVTGVKEAGCRPKKQAALSIGCIGTCLT
jgi:hypothetical protein